MLINFIRRRFLILVTSLFLFNAVIFGIFKINSVCACSADLFDSSDSREEFYIDKINSEKTRSKIDKSGYKYAKYKIYEPNEIDHPMYKMHKVIRCSNKRKESIIKCEILLGKGFYGLFKNFVCDDKISNVKVVLKNKANLYSFEVLGKIENFEQKFSKKAEGISEKKLYFEILEQNIVDSGVYEVTILKNDKFNGTDSNFSDKFYVDLDKSEVSLPDKF